MKSHKNKVRKRPPTLSLVALMDIFTVLVFFLMFNVHNEQAINVGEVANLPASTQAVDILKPEAKVDTLEILDEQSVMFNGQQVKTEDDDALSTLITSYCERAETRSTDCNALAIEAPNDMSYLLVNRFVELGKTLNFQKIYLIVTQRH
ncbi:TPA: ExbD/TolR family protein [Vibrio parahaemolyticus]